MALEASWLELPVWSGAQQALDAIEGRTKLGIVTNCSKRLGLLAAARLTTRWDCVVTAEDAGYYKPDPHLYPLALKSLWVSAVHAGFVPGSDRRTARVRGLLPTGTTDRPALREPPVDIDRPTSIAGCRGWKDQNEPKKLSCCGSARPGFCDSACTVPEKAFPFRSHPLINRFAGGQRCAARASAGRGDRPQAKHRRRKHRGAGEPSARKIHQIAGGWFTPRRHHRYPSPTSRSTKALRSPRISNPLAGRRGVDCADCQIVACGCQSRGIHHLWPRQLCHDLAAPIGSIAFFLGDAAFIDKTQHPTCRTAGSRRP